MLLRRLSDWPRSEWESPFDELERMRRQMSQLARRFPSGRYEEPSAGVFPLINVSEDKDAFYVRAELPGIKAEDLDISVTGESLSIGGERKIEVEEENVKYHRREREAGEFSRIVNLPSLIDTEKVEARCADGILEIVMPKSAATKPKQICIKSP